jgi:hypothetical protein
MNQHVFVRRTGFLVVALSVVLGSVSAQAGVTRTVTVNSDSGAGSLRQAIADSADGDAITFAPTLSGTILISSSLVFTKTLTITGPGARKLNVAGTAAVFRLFHVMGGNIVVSNLTIGPGGIGVYINGGTLKLNNCAVSGNAGGGVFVSQGTTLMMDKCTISGNQLDVQAGAGLENSGVTTLTNCTIAGNQSKKNANSMISSGYGGGISNNLGALTLVSCTVTGNTAELGAGGVASGGGTFTVSNTIISGNTAPSGPDGSGAFTSQGYNLIGIKDSMTGFTNNVNHDIAGTAASPVNGALGSLRDNGGPTDTAAISVSTSPARNGANPATAPARDQRNFVRQDAPDIGAFEFQALQPVNLANISSRAVIQTGDNVLIGGFIITGNQLKKVILRAIGPSLPLPGKISDPILELYQGNQLLFTSDDWMSAPNKQAIIDSGLAPGDPHESAILTSLGVGAYTFIVRGSNNAVGIGVVEAYDLDRSVNAKLANISTRAFVQTGDNVLIGGFIVVGPDSAQVIVRAIGPSLNLPNKLLDPALQLFNGNGTAVGSNDNWKSTQQATITATGLAPTNDFEAAILTTLTPGNYTAIVSGVGNTSGVAVVEAYGLQ